MTDIDRIYIDPDILGDFVSDHFGRDPAEVRHVLDDLLRALEGTRAKSPSPRRQLTVDVERNDGSVISQASDALIFRMKGHHQWKVYIKSEYVRRRGETRALLFVCRLENTRKEPPLGRLSLIAQRARILSSDAHSGVRVKPLCGKKRISRG